MTNEAIDLVILIKTMIEKGASDLHLTVGVPPSYRIDGQMVRSKTAPLTADDTKRICYSLITEDQRRVFEKNQELDFAFGLKGVARLRANLFVQRGTIAGVFRRIQNNVPELANLGFNAKIQALVEKPNGLILVTGATGSGKSTTIAAFIDAINTRTRNHIVTIEDPIEFTHHHKLSIVNQREVGTDCESFALALRQVLREDPDVIMVGEIRDSDTAEAALRAAETGHLVFSTLHTNGALNSINRIVQMFNTEQQEYVRSLLSFTLAGILSQALLPRLDGHGRILAYEYLAMNPAIRHLIRDNKLHQVYGQMQIGQDQTGMVTLNQNLSQLIISKTITQTEAYAASPDVDELQKLLDRATPTRKAS
jgi:twitching motility protein PilT